MSASGRDPWDGLRDDAEARLATGRRALVVALGAGLNTQAGGVRSGVSWMDLLARIAERAQCDEARAVLARGPYLGSTTALWESMLVARAGQSDLGAAKVESWLLQLVAEELSHARYPAPESAGAFLARVDALGLGDVLSFNFDTWLCARASGTGTALRGRRGACRVWYPHGHVSRASSIRLGLRRYGLHVDEIEHALRAHKAAERRAADHAAFVAARRESAGTWIDATLHAPLVFVGMSLQPDEGPLWWYLGQRARNHARNKDAPRTYALVRSAAGDRDHDRLCATCEVLGVRVLHFEKFAEGWERLFETLAGA